MNRILNANNLTFRTYNHLKVNEVNIDIDVEKKDYYLESDSKAEISEFKNYNYGISDDILEFNESYLNLYKLYENEDKVVEMKLDANNDQLIDIHDVISSEGKTTNVTLIYESDEKNVFRSSLIRLLAKKDSTINLFIVQNDKHSKALESVFALTEENAKVNVYQFELGAKELYTNLQSNLMGKESSINVNSIYLGHGKNELNMLYNIFHYGESTESNLLINGALKDNAYKNFKSTLDFKEGSFESKGSEEEYAILLDEDVRAISVPVLLAHEDNVEGNHAASAGKIDQDLLFYIMSRGFSQNEAESLIIQSKFSYSVDAITDENLKEKVWNRIIDIVRR